jgi:mRNA interferase MazF
MNEPRRGEVWMVDLGMAAKVRPCLVISVGAGEEDRALATLVPHTTSVRHSRFEVKLKVSFLREGAFDAQSLVTIPHAKLVRKLGVLPVTHLVQVEAAVAKWLGLELQQSNKTG